MQQLFEIQPHLVNARKRRNSDGLAVRVRRGRFQIVEWSGLGTRKQTVAALSDWLSVGAVIRELGRLES